MKEVPTVFACDGERMFGIFHLPQQIAASGVLIVVGGPQYRIGSHRQFVLLARLLAESGIAVFRFDYRGMGDSEGAMRDFEAIDLDIRAAIDHFMKTVPAVKDIVLWGLCDAASAGLLYAPSDSRVKGLVLVNPWARTEQGIARAHLRHYYLQRLINREFWRKILHGEFKLRAALGSFIGMAAASLGMQRTPQCNATDRGGTVGTMRGPLPDRLADALRRFRGRLQIILSGDDLTANEFRAVANGSPAWRALVKDRQVTVYELPGANHTFSRRPWREQIAAWTAEMTRS